MYNLTIYQQAPPNKAFCYCWIETEGRRGSNEIGTALHTWCKQLSSDVKEVSLYSNSCPGQNKNSFIAALLLHSVESSNTELKPSLIHS